MSEGLFALFNRIKEDGAILTVSEAQTSQGIVLPILHNLGWNVFDTNEVTPEFSVGGKRVDFALRIQSQNKVFLEIKKTSENLENHHEQLVYYAFQQGVKQAILTNGITWQFYLPLEEGSWEQRKFFTIDLLEQRVEDSIEKFENLLSKRDIESGIAHQNAKSLYEGRQKNKILKETLPKAWKKLVSDPDEMLIELLNETVEKISGYKADDSQIADFLRQVPFTPSHSVVLTKTPKPTIAHAKPVETSPVPSETGQFIALSFDNLSTLRFAKILDGRFADGKASNWRELINIGLRIANQRGISLETLSEILTANLKHGQHSEKTFTPTKGTDFSMQNMDAPNTAKNILKLAEFLKCEVYVMVEWQQGKLVGKRGLINLKP